MDKKKKKQEKKESKDILNVLIPDQLKKANENSGWCGTIPVKPKVRKLGKRD